MYEEMTQAILDMLEAASTIGPNIKRFYFGEHDLRKPDTLFPFIDCKWLGGPIATTKTGATIKRRQSDFAIRCIHRNVNEDVAEKFVMDMAEKIEAVLDADDTLNGEVESSVILEVLSDSMPEGGYSVVGTRILLTTKK